MLKPCLLTAIALLSLNLASGQLPPSSSQDSSLRKDNDCSQTAGPCRESDQEGGRYRVPIGVPAVNPVSIHVDDNPANSSRQPHDQALDNVLPMPPEPPTEFQQFVETSIGKRLVMFGYDLFRGVPSTFAPVDRVPVPANYVIGPGDELLIRAWGQIDVDARLIVDRNGQVYLPKIGSVSVAGVAYEELPDHIKTTMSRVFRNFELRVTLGQLRSIQIFVVGYARRPGVYTVSSLSTLVNALFASGGPSLHGSLRHIQLKRGDRVVTDLDMYDLLLRGDKSKDIALLPGDVVYIPPIGPQVALAGSVNFPAIYELNSTATLADELEIAGGLTSIADGGRVIVERVDNHSTRKVEQFGLDSAGKSREVHDGDLIRVFSISPRFDNAVTLRGNVAEPGRYPFRDGMRVRDLIPNREFLLTREFWHNQNGRRDRLQPGDEWARNGRSWKDDEGAAHPQPSGTLAALREGRPGDGDNSWKSDPSNPEPKERSLDSRDGSEIHGQMELRNDIKRNAPDVNWDYAVIQRLNPADLSTTLIPFNLGKAVLENNETDNVLLQPGDVVTIFSQRDIEVSHEHQSKYVRLEGEFHAPGVYKVGPNETLLSLISRAGGLTQKAYMFGAQFTRESARQQQQASLDRMVQDLEMEAQHQSVYVAAMHPDQQQNLQSQMETHRLLIDRLRAVKATGRIVLDLMPDEKGAHSIQDVPLEDGDRLFVPSEPSTVSVVGSVYNQSSFLFRDRARVVNYLKAAGGGTRDADLRHMFVIRANGSVVSRDNTSGMWAGGLDAVRVLPGDTVVVPAKLDKGGTIRAIKDWSQVIGQIGLGAAAINVLK